MLARLLPTLILLSILAGPAQIAFAHDPVAPAEDPDTGESEREDRPAASPNLRPIVIDGKAAAEAEQRAHRDAIRMYRVLGWSANRPIFTERIAVSAPSVLDEYRASDFGQDLFATVDLPFTTGDPFAIHASMFANIGGRIIAGPDGRLGASDLVLGLRLGEMRVLPVSRIVYGLAWTHAFGIRTADREVINGVEVPASVNSADFFAVENFTYSTGLVGFAAGPNWGLVSHIQLGLPFDFPTEVAGNAEFEFTLHGDAGGVRVGVQLSSAFIPLTPYLEAFMGDGAYTLGVRFAFPIGQGPNPGPVGDWVIISYMTVAAFR